MQIAPAHLIYWILTCVSRFGLDKSKRIGISYQGAHLDNFINVLKWVGFTKLFI